MGIPNPREKDIQAACLQWLNLQPHCFAWRVNSGAIVGMHNGRRRFVRFNSAAGCSDIIGLIEGCFFAVEVKRPGERPTVDQQTFQAQVDAAHGLALVVTSLDELIAAFKLEGLVD